MHIQNSGPPQQKHRGFGACSSRAVRAHAASMACSTGDSDAIWSARPSATTRRWCSMAKAVRSFRSISGALDALRSTAGEGGS